MKNRELWLARTMVDLAEAFETDQCEGELARYVIAPLTELLAPAHVGLLLADGSGRLLPAGASADRIADLMALQARQHQGPGIDSHHSGQIVLNETIESASTRWPLFAAAARAAGLSIASAIPLRHRDEAVGVVCVLAAGGHHMTAAQFSLTQVLARTAAMALAQRRDTQRNIVLAEQLQHALDSRVLIEQAKGAVAARLGVTPEAAFQLLRAYARQASRPLVEIAAEVIGDRLPAHMIVGARDASSRPAMAKQPQYHSG